MAAFPERSWDSAAFSLNKKRSRQKWLSVLLRDIYGGESIIVENYSHPRLLWQGNSRMEIDLWMPQHNLGLEYQGEQHYHELEHFKTNDKIQSYRKDKQKLDACQRENIALVTVPYWWDQERESLRLIMDEVLNR